MINTHGKRRSTGHFTRAPLRRPRAASWLFCLALALGLTTAPGPTTMAAARPADLNIELGARPDQTRGGVERHQCW